MTTQTLPTVATPVLTAHDRCDRCGSRAYLRARLGNHLELMFCAHHGHEHLGKLLELTTDILDEREFLQAPSP